MSTSALTCFQQLKEDTAATARRACPDNPADIRTWKGQQIRCFQEDLMRRVNGRISEKWFYTHIKADREPLPREDMLDLLSRYVGYESWDDYRRQHATNEPAASTQESRRLPWLWIVGGLLLAGLLGFYIRSQRAYSYQFCFVNAYSKQAVDASEIRVVMVANGESPYALPVDEAGCLTVRTHHDRVQLVVRSSYYKNDTITRVLDKVQPNERVALETDDYAWMIRLFSGSDVDDWQRRRAQLDSMIAPEARIYQLYDDQALGLELYNKQEFINKLTMPLRSLRHLEVLDIRYQDKQIEVLRFKQKNHATEP